MPPVNPALGPWSRMPRLFAAVLLGLQALLWGGGSILEARAAAESLARSSHIEDQGSTTCPPIHSHLDCLICRTLTGGATGGTAPALLPLAAGVSERLASAVVEITGLNRGGHLGSRAPPLADRHAPAA